MQRKRPMLGVVTRSGEIRWIARKKKSWWQALTFVGIAQAVFGLLAVVSLVFGKLFFGVEEWHAAAISFLTAFLSMFVLWEIEYFRFRNLRNKTTEE